MRKTSFNNIRRLFELKAEKPELSLSALGKTLGMSKTAVFEHLSKATAAGISPKDVLYKSDEELATIFGAETRQNECFAEPDYEQVRLYLNAPRVSGKLMPSLKDAWHFLYLKQFFPDYNAGELPATCMSLSTFIRRYNDYLEQNKLAGTKHSATPSLNFGPGSMIEIDMIGDDYEFIDLTGNKHITHLFTAVCKYSGLIYAEALEHQTTVDWCRALVNALYTIGGVPEVIRADNDVAITNHGSKSKGTHTVFKQEFIQLFQKLGTQGELCPVRRPTYKGGNERSNGLANQQLFADPDIILPIHCKDLKAFNEIILKCVERINLMPRANNQLSRRAIFEADERKSLKRLPTHRPAIIKYQEVTVYQDGCVRYLYNKYVVGTELAGTLVLIAAINGTTLKVYHKDSFKEIVEYPIDYRREHKEHVHKADCFKTAEEQAVTRDCAWFEAFVNKKGNESSIDVSKILETIRAIFAQTPKAQATAVRKCSRLIAPIQAEQENIGLLSHVCGLIMEKKRRGGKFNFDELLRLYRSLKDSGISLSLLQAANVSHSPSITQQSQSRSINLRGAQYYANK